MKHFALAGNPNCGKTTLFNTLTGSTAYVGNWPGVTVDKREGTYKKLKEHVSIVDLPGIYSLSPYSPEEVISRNFILDEKPDCIINVVDATNLERNLYLTTQILEIDVPVVIALNMMDVVTKEGSKINCAELEKKFGVPVVEISALKMNNIDKLMKTAYECCLKKRIGKTVLENSDLIHLIGDVRIAFEAIKVNNPLFHAIKLVEMDEIETKNHPDLIHIVEEYKGQFKDETFGSDFEAIVADARYKYITDNFDSVITKPKKEINDKNAKPKVTTSDKIDRVLTNKWASIPIFLAILFVIFHLVFSTNFLFLKPAFGGTTSFAGTMFEGLFWTEDGFNSPGVFLQTLLGCLTDGLTGAINDAMVNAAAPAWATGLVCDGILAGLFSILSFLPQILMLFLFFSILEDSGYMARVAFILDRIFRKFGLSGRSLLPMIMGFGCSVPAMINTRTLTSDNEKVATIRVIPFFSCGAKLPILTGIAGAIVTAFGIGNADLITFLMYLLGMAVAIISIILMRNTIMRGKVPPFIMELPAYHLPQFKSLMVHLRDKLKHFIKKAFTIILASTILIWFVLHFNWSWQFLEDGDINQSIIASLGTMIQPIFTPLGFGAQLGKWGWVFVVAAITGLIAKENVIATFGTLAACVSAAFVASGTPLVATDDIEILLEATNITVPALLSFISFNMLTIPCFAAVGTAKAELPKGKMVGTILFWIATSFIVSSMIYLVGEFIWPIAIIVVAIALAIVAIILINKYRDNKSKLKEA